MCISIDCFGEEIVPWLVLVLASVQKRPVLCRNLNTMNLSGTVPLQLSNLKELQML